MDQVYFVNCTFKMRKAKPRARLSTKILASVPYYFLGNVAILAARTQFLSDDRERSAVWINHLFLQRSDCDWNLPFVSAICRFAEWEVFVTPRKLTTCDAFSLRF
jgi:hypothetical protein